LENNSRFIEIASHNKDYKNMIAAAVSDEIKEIEIFKQNDCN